MILLSEKIETPVGAIIMWTTNIAPIRFLLCQGQEVSRNNYSGLFNIIGTTYGIGNGIDTFNLPNLKQRFPLGKADSGTGSNLGDTGGVIDHTHNVTVITDPVLIALGVSTVGAEGTYESEANNPPFLVINYIIKT